MANSKQLFISLAIIAIFVPSISAVEYVVGDEKGWTINFDYQAWAQGKEFHVGDKLVFKYREGDHNVFKVDGVGFKECVTPADDTSALTSGNDVITLTTPGRKWYICGVPQHCQVGNQKLLITVIDDDVASPTPSPSPSQDIQPSSANILNSFSTLAFITTLFLILSVVGVFFG